MMTPLRWFLLCGLLILYLLIGGAMFMGIEQAHETQQNEHFGTLKKDVREVLLLLDRKYYDNETSPSVLNAIETAKEEVINRISESCGGHNLLDESDVPTELRWSYYNSVFFAFTAVTTIGYGNLSPTTYWSRVLTMIYALFGIPINGILISGLSKYFASKLINVHKRSKDKLNGNKMSFIFDIAFYLIPGLLVFVVVPAGFFVVIEGWPYLDAIYFSFITLTTIGFGDYVAGMGDGHSVWLWVYKICMIIWIIFGLGYFVMILNFITKGMTHKKVKSVINKRLSKIKTTKDKLVKDIDYLRRVVNELYMMKIRPVYNDDDDEGCDNDACSVISGEKYQVYDRSVSQPHIFRRTHLSNLSLDLQSLENLDRAQKKESTHVRRRCSETDLDRIDREKTFEEAIKHSVLPEELLATVITVLADNINNADIEDESDNDSVDIDIDSDDEDETDDEGISSEDVAAHVPPWELGLLHESDEEILLDDGSIDDLQQVVVHSVPAPPAKPSDKSSILSKPQMIQKKVSEMIRKISAGSKDPNEGRKISRNESDKMAKKKISYDPDPGPGELLKKNLAQATIVPVHKVSKDHEKDKNRKISSEAREGRKISKEHETHRRRKTSGSSPRISREHSPNIGGHHHHRHNVWELDNNMRRSGRSSPHHYVQNQLGTTTDSKLPNNKPPSSTNSSCGNSRKISRENQFDHSHELDHTALSDLLRALDTVHDRLKRSNSRERVNKISNTSSSFVPNISNANHSEGSNPINQVNSKPNNVSTPTNAPPTPTAPTVSNSSKLKRRRKIGVFNPDFTYVNPSFQKDTGDKHDKEDGDKKLTVDNDEERKISKEESKL